EPVLREQVPEHARDAEILAVFQTLNEPIERIGVPVRNEARIHEHTRAETTTADCLLGAAERQGLRAHPTTRSVERQVVLARHAQIASVCTDSLAQHTVRRPYCRRDLVPPAVDFPVPFELTGRNSLRILHANALLARSCPAPRPTGSGQTVGIRPEMSHTTTLDLARLGEVRTDWTVDEVRALFALPFSDLLFHAQRVHRTYFDPNRVQISTLLSIKTGACPEDCAYCSQSIRFQTGVKAEPLMSVEEVIEKAKAAKAKGATRFCMGAAYRSPKPKQLAQTIDMIKAVRALGMETCATLGMLTPEQARALKEAGLEYYNHNLDTSESHYAKVITTRTYQDRLATLEAVRAAGINVCCG